MNSDIIEYVLLFHDKCYLLEKKRYKKQKAYISNHINIMFNHFLNIDKYKISVFNLYESLTKYCFMPEISIYQIFNMLSYFFNNKEYHITYDPILCIYIKLYEYLKNKNKTSKIYIASQFKQVVLN